MVRYEVFFTLRPAILFSANTGGEKTFRSGDGTLSITGDRLSVIFELPEINDNSATEYARQLADQLCDSFAAASGEYAYWEQKDYRKWVCNRELYGSQLPMSFWVSNYELSRVVDDIERAGVALGFENGVLVKSRAYLRHGIFLWQQGWRTEGLDLRSVNAQLLATEIILNFNKAVTTIVGDKTIEGERNQMDARRQALGLQESMLKRIEQLRQLRNDADVAHHSLQPARLMALQAERKFALDTAKDVIEIFMSHLKRGGDLSPWAQSPASPI